MTKAEEILEKHLANNIDQRTYLRGSKLTYDICIDAVNEAIKINIEDFDPFWIKYLNTN